MSKTDQMDDIVVHESTGNVFADLGLPASEEDMLKIEIVRAITATITKRGLTQAKAGELIGVDQAKVSQLLRGRISGFSIERLMTFLLRLGRDVEIRISREHRGRDGKMRVKEAVA